MKEKFKMIVRRYEYKEDKKWRDLYIIGIRDGVNRYIYVDNNSARERLIFKSDESLRVLMENIYQNYRKDGKISWYNVDDYETNIPERMTGFLLDVDNSPGIHKVKFCGVAFSKNTVNLFDFKGTLPLYANYDWNRVYHTIYDYLPYVNDVKSYMNNNRNIIKEFLEGDK